MPPIQWSVRFATGGSIASLLLLQFCQKLLEYQLFPVPDSDWKTGSAKIINTTNITIISISSTTNATESTSLALVGTWVYTCRYLLPVLGGLLSCGLGHVRVLQLSGGVMLAASGAQVANMYFFKHWRAGDSPLFVVGGLLLVVYNGMVIPSIMHGILSKRTRQKIRTVLCALIYLASMSGLYSGLILAFLSPFHSVFNRYVICFAVNVAVYCVIAFLVLPSFEATLAAAAEGPEFQEDAAPVATWRWRPVQLLTMNRLKRCCLVFGAFVPIRITLYDDRWSTVITTPNGNDDWFSLYSWNPLISCVATIVIIIVSVAWQCQLSRRLPVKPRLILGILLETALELALVVVFIVNPEINVYIVACIVDAVAAPLVVVAVYELMDGFERDGARPLIVGVLLTVRGLAIVASRLLVTVCSLMSKWDLDNPGLSIQMSVYHGILFVLLLCSLAYCRFSAFPAANTLIVNYPDEHRVAGVPGRHVQRHPAADFDDRNLNDESSPLVGNLQSSEM